MSKFLTREQYHKIKWKEIYTQEDCPFCKKEENSRNIVREWKYWYILQNLFPYSWNDKHIMAVPYKHKKYSIELSDEEFLELKNIQRFVKDFYIEENYFSCTRETMWNRSVEHLHIHFCLEDYNENI